MHKSGHHLKTDYKCEKKNNLKLYSYISPCQVSLCYLAEGEKYLN